MLCDKRQHTNAASCMWLETSSYTLPQEKQGKLKRSELRPLTLKSSIFAYQMVIMVQPPSDWERKKENHDSYDSSTALCESHLEERQLAAGPSMFGLRLGKLLEWCDGMEGL